MKLNDISNEMEEMEQKIFSYSLWNNLTITELGSMYSSIIRLKSAFFTLDLMECSKEDIDSLRFKIAENTLNLKMIIKERLKINCQSDMIQMESLLKSIAS